ncbi:MAG: hypothetical protein GX622_14725 [Bacteroidales bacterium]|nr:hypothetical protein [Bacteroidales bacterium]
MKKIFQTYSGEISFEENHLQINDNQPKWLKATSLAAIISAVIYGILLIAKFSGTNDPFDFWPGLLMVILGIPAGIVQWRITYIDRIAYDDMRSVKIHRNMANHLFADIKIHTGMKRRIVLDEEDLGRFSRDHLDELLKVFNKKRVPIIST